MREIRKKVLWRGGVSMAAAMLCLGVLMPAGAALAGPGYDNADTVRDVIDIQRVENGVIGIVEGRDIYRLNLDLKENIVWRGAEGTVGAVLTSDRCLALSEASRGWAELPLKLEEASDPGAITPLISDYLVMFVTSKRILGFDAASGRWVVASIPIHDRVVESHINSYVAAVITNNRLLAWASERSGFAEKDLVETETIRSVETRPHTVTVRTNRRVLVFSSRSGGWRQFDEE